MKNQMYGAEVLWKSEHVGTLACLSDNQVRSKHFFAEFLGWAGCPEEFCLHIDIVAYAELQCWTPTMVSRFLVSLLGSQDVFLEFLV